jgi:hypothetical protein
MLTTKPFGPRAEHLAIDQVFAVRPPGVAMIRKSEARASSVGGAEAVGHVAAMLPVVVAHAHVEAVGGALGDGHADGTEAEDAQALAGQGRAHDLRPFAPAHGGVAARNIAYQ